MPIVFIRACLALLTARLLLAVGGWRRLIDALPPSPTPPSHPPESLLRRLASACASAALAVPFQTACLERAFAACCVLRSRGFPATLQIGMRTSPPLTFHAWVEVDGVVVNGESMLRRQFRVISTH